MSDKLVIGVDDLDPRDDVRKYFERKSQEIKERASGAVRPTEVGLTDPSQSLKNYCPKCGASHGEPFGNYKIASRLNAHGIQVEVYPCGGVIVYSEHEMTVSTKRSSGLGTSGQLGYTRVVLAPDK